jgi:hypothetical protein
VKPIGRFALERHAGPYESWPLRSRLLLDGAPTRVTLPGYVILHQFETKPGFLIATDCDCPYEEATTFALLAADLRVLSIRTFSTMYGSFLLDALEWIDASHLVATFHGGLRYRITIRERGIPFVRPRLGVRRVR